MDNDLYVSESLKNSTNQLEFVYLVPADPDAPQPDPYNLKIVPHSEVNQTDFYTMSAAGVTHFVNGVAGISLFH
jgi:hypothetical protein